MASSKGQAVLTTTKGRILSTSATNGQSIGATTAPQYAASKLVPLKEQGEHQRHESVINLTLLEAPKHVVEAHQMTSQSGQRVMTIGVTSIEEQLAQISEAIAKLTKTAEEKDLQISALVNKLGARHYEGFSSDSKKGGDEEEGPPVEKAEEKLEPDQAAALMGSLSIKQLQEMIASTVKA
ncbi:hypothetical protein ACFXTO_035557 [Malus domestica]